MTPPHGPGTTARTNSRFWHDAPMPSPLRLEPALPALALTLLLAGCGGGGGAASGCRTDADCSDGSACSVDTCNAASGQCHHAQGPATASFALFGGAPSSAVPLVEQSGSSSGVSYTICPGGAVPGASPPVCTAVLTPDGAAALSLVSTATLNLQGGFATSLATAPVSYTVASVPGSLSLAVSADGSCPGAAASPSTGGHLDLTFSWPTAPDDGLRVQAVNSFQAGLSGLHGCGGLSSVVDLVAPVLVDTLTPAAMDQLVHQVEQNLCRAPPCPAGTADVLGLCRYPSGNCAPRLGPAGLLEPRGCRP